MAEQAGVASWSINEIEPTGGRDQHFQDKYRHCLVELCALCVDGISGNDSDGMQELHWLTGKVTQLMLDLEEKARNDYLAAHFEIED